MHTIITVSFFLRDDIIVKKNKKLQCLMFVIINSNTKQAQVPRIIEIGTYISKGFCKHFFKNFV